MLEARDEHLKKKRRQRIMIMRCVPALSTFCIAIILGLGYWKHISKMSEAPEIDTISPIAEATTDTVPTSEEASAVNKTEYNTTQQTTEQISTQSVTTNISSTVISQENTASKTETEKTVTHLEISELSTETHTEPPKPTEAITETVSDTPTEQPTTLDGDQSECTDNHIYLHWDEMTINQQYFFAEFGEPTLSYSTAEKEVSANEVGEYISQAYMSGYDWYELIYYHCETEAYRIKGDDEAKTIAIKFEDDENYYLYTLNEPNNDDEPSD